MRIFQDDPTRFTQAVQVVVMRALGIPVERVRPLASAVFDDASRTASGLVFCTVASRMSKRPTQPEQWIVENIPPSIKYAVPGKLFL